MRNTAIFLFSLLFIISCSERVNKSNEKSENLTLTKVDSIQVPYLGLLNLMDVHPQSGKVLLFDQQAGTLVVGDFEENQVTEFNKNTDAPDSYGAYPLGAGKFSEDGRSFTIISNQGIYTYDLKGNLINGGKHKVEKMPAFSGRPAADMEFFWVGDKILTTAAGRTQFDRNTTEFYENYTSLAWFDTLERKVDQFFYLDETSFFRNGKAHDLSHMIPRMTADMEHIYLIQGIEPALNIHSINAPYKKITRVPLHIADYHFNQGLPFSEANPRMISPDIFSGLFENLKVTDQYILISFFPGVPELDQDKYENLFWTELLPRLREVYPHRMLVMDKKGNLLKEIPLPAEFNTRQWLERDGYLWFLATVNLEEEEDFAKIYKVKLGEK